MATFALDSKRPARWGFLFMEDTMTNALTKFDVARQAIAEARTVDEVKVLRDRAEQARAYAKQQREGREMQNDIAEIKLRAERRLGEMLDEMDKAKGGRPEITGNRVLPVIESPTLSDIGISKMQSSRWQRAAKIPEETFEAHIAEVKDKPDGELTSATIQRLARGIEKENHRKDRRDGNDQEYGLYTIEDSTIIIGDASDMNLEKFDRYGVIVADPPWPYRVAKGQGIAEDQYAVMTDGDLRAMPISQLALDNCVLLLWGTWPKLPEAIQLMTAWGFEYVTGFPWVKTNSKNGQPFYGVGYWVRGCSEYVLIGRRGHVSPPRMKGFMGILSPGFKHSRKPDSVHDIAEALPGPYLELFGRRSRPGWTVFGNEVEELML
jgi:N6-adenosine-specific RNA methylase IME4